MAGKLSQLEIGRIEIAKFLMQQFPRGSLLFIFIFICSLKFSVYNAGEAH